MIRATVGTWLNYATTLIFQILFAAAFGTSADASGFVIAFAIAISASGIFVTTALWVVLPRMMAEDGAISRRAVRILAALAVGVGVLGLGLATVGVVAPQLTAALIGLPASRAQPVILTAALLLVILAIAGVLSSVAVARGHRFLPAVAPAMPSTAGAVYLAFAPAPDVDGTLLAMTAGATVQAGFLAYLAAVPAPRIIDTPPLRSRSLAIGMVTFLVLLNFLPPLQRVVATSVSNAGAAQIDYAIRGLQVVLQLLIGGLVISTLPDWAAMRRRASLLRADIIRATALTGLLLAVAGSVLLVSIQPIIAIVLERGAFDADDTAAVTLLVRILVPGFVAEGLTLVLSQALLAARFTRLFLWIGFLRFVAIALPTVGLGLWFGAVGVATAYSLGFAATAVVTGAACARAGMFRGGSSVLLRTTLTTAPVVAVAAALLTFGTQWELLATAMVLAVAVVGAFVWRLTELIPAGILRRLHATTGGHV